MNGTRIYGPYDAEPAIAEYQRQQALALDITTRGYSEGEAAFTIDDPVQVELATFAHTPEEERRAEAETIVRERA